MNVLLSPPPYVIPPDHKQLPDSDGAIVINFQEHPQSVLLSDAILPVLRRLHPDGQFVVGQDSGIYWRQTEPPLDGCKAPDWYYVPNRPPLLGGELRRSYVLWAEGVAPAIVIEFVSGDGSEERDRTFATGKFWVYEQGIRVPYYAIFDGFRGTLEVYHLVDGRYHPVLANERGRYPIAPMAVELGLWRGRFMEMDTVWLRWWGADGNLLPTHEEQSIVERQAKEEAQRRTDEERQAKEEAQRRTDEERQAKKEAQRQAGEANEKARRLAERLRALGVDPDEV